MHCYSLTKTETSKMINASNKFLAVELFTINAFFLSFDSNDVAYTLACFAMVICGISLRMVMLYKKAQKEGGSLTRQTVVLHFIVAICICWVSYFGWREGLNKFLPFRFFGLPLYLFFCSFLSMYILEQLDKIGELSVGRLFKYFYERFFLDIKGAQTKEINTKDSVSHEREDKDL
jgi:hypothetical protein